MEVKWIIIMVLALIIGFLIGFFTGRAKRRKYDGTLLIGTVEEREKFQFLFSTELEDLRNQHELVMKIEHSQNSQPL